MGNTSQGTNLNKIIILKGPMQLCNQMITPTRKVNKVNLLGGPTMKSHMTQSRLDSEGIVDGYWLGSRTWYFNSNQCESMRARALRIYFLKYLHHHELNWVMMNSDIEVLIRHRILPRNKIWLLDRR
jgi:hypothetical protein